MTIFTSAILTQAPSQPSKEIGLGSSSIQIHNHKEQKKNRAEAREVGVQRKEWI